MPSEALMWQRRKRLRVHLIRNRFSMTTNSTTQIQHRGVDTLHIKGREGPWKHGMLMRNRLHQQRWDREESESWNDDEGKRGRST